MITSVVWIPYGAANPLPEFYNPTEEEIENLTQLKKKVDEDSNSIFVFSDFSLSDDEEDDEEGEGENEDKEMELEDNDENENNKIEQEKMEGYEDTMKEFDMENYDDEPDELTLFGKGIKGLAYHDDNNNDPYITMEQEHSDGDIDDLTLRDSDHLFIVARTEEDLSYLEVQIYEEADNNSYVHHDIMLSSFPLCVEWLGYGGSQSTAGNFAAVGTFLPEIEVWDLDVIDVLTPTLVLGENSDKRVKKTPKISPVRHIDSVLGLSWNRAHKNILASCSADTTVKIWDLTNSKCLRSFDHHKDKVQSIEWNVQETNALLSGAFGGNVYAYDIRMASKAAAWKASADVEKVAWNTYNPAYFAVSTEDGLVTYYDARQPGKSIWTLSAHDDAVCSMQFHPSISDCILTSSYDNTLKIWDIKDNRPSCVLSRDMEVGKIFSSSFSEHIPFVLLAGGAKGDVAVWNTSQASEIRKHFEGRNEKPNIVINQAQENLAQELSQTKGEQVEEQIEESKPKKKKSKSKSKNKSKK